MMNLQSPEEVKLYLIHQKWVSAIVPLKIEPMSGGVSNQVWKIAGSDIRWVLKQALPKLKVEADWYADVRRIEREREVMEAFQPLLDEGVIPQVLHSDPVAHTFIMTCAPENAVTWKRELMQSRFDREAAKKAGQLLSAMHGRSAERAQQLREPFDDLSFFDELRIDPFHRYLISSYPELAKPISAVITELMKNRSCLVHGDYSPKNILIAPDRRMTVLDFEVAHWGNPLFDVAFLAAHLMLKGWALGRTEEAFAMVGAFLNGYGGAIGGLLPHLGVLLLARVDGKSPVEYIRDDHVKAIVRNVGMTWIRLADDRSSWTNEWLLREIRQVLEEGKN